MKDEPTIMINGRTLQSSQAMAVRVAVTDFESRMGRNPDGLGKDDHGRNMVRLYRERAKEVLHAMFETAAAPTVPETAHIARLASLEYDCTVLALRLYGEDPATFAPETQEVMARWLPKCQALLRGEG